MDLLTAALAPIARQATAFEVRAWGPHPRRDVTDLGGAPSAG